MARIVRFIAASLSILGYLLSPLVAFASGVVAWPAFHPSPGESIALDVASRAEGDARQPGILARFAEYARRGLTHDEFSAGRYDPGWRIA